MVHVFVVGEVEVWGGGIEGGYEEGGCWEEFHGGRRGCGWCGWCGSLIFERVL